MPESLLPLESASLSARRGSRTLAALRVAHEAFAGAMAALKRAFGGGTHATFPDVVPSAASNPTVAAGPDVLRYVLVHISGLISEARQLPGGSQALDRQLMFADLAIQRTEQPSVPPLSTREMYRFPLPGPLPRQVNQKPIEC